MPRDMRRGLPQYDCDKGRPNRLHLIAAIIVVLSGRAIPQPPRRGCKGSPRHHKARGSFIGASPFRQITGVALARAAGEEACVWGAYHGQSRHGCRAVFFHARIRYSGCDRRCEVVHLTKNRLSHRPARDRERSRGTSAPRPLPPAADITAKMLTAALAE